jgi:hypothetical protein
LQVYDPSVAKSNALRGFEGRLAMAWQYNLSDAEWDTARRRAEEFALQETARDGESAPATGALRTHTGPAEIPPPGSDSALH